MQLNGGEEVQQQKWEKRSRLKRSYTSFIDIFSLCNIFS